MVPSYPIAPRWKKTEASNQNVHTPWMCLFESFSVLERTRCHKCFKIFFSDSEYRTNRECLLHFRRQLLCTKREVYTKRGGSNIRPSQILTIKRWVGGWKNPFRAVSARPTHPWGPKSEKPGLNPKNSIGDMQGNLSSPTYFLGWLATSQSKPLCMVIFAPDFEAQISRTAWKKNRNN